MSNQLTTDWGGTPVYPRLSLNGILVALMPDGTVKATSGRGHAPVEIAKLTFGNTGNPWTPTHRNFNKTAKRMYRDGDFDELIRERENRQARRAALRKAAPDLLAALEQAVRFIDDCPVTPVGLHDWKQLIKEHKP
jgi:hypothetical protein